MSQPICWHCVAGVQLFKRCRNLPAGTVMQRCRLFKQCWNLPAGHCVARVQAVYAVSELTSPALWWSGAGCLNGVWTYLLGTVKQGCRLFKWCQFLPPEQVRSAELDILLYFYFRTDQMKPWYMQLLLLRGAFFFLLREIYSVRMSTSEFGSIILLNKESLHLILVDSIWKFDIV